MNVSVFREMIAVIRTEGQRRGSLLADVDYSVAYDQCLFYHEPFLNELCLMLLVALRHQVERELVSLAARAGHGAGVISAEQYQEEVAKLTKGRHIKWKRIDTRLHLEARTEYNSMKALQLLANSFKHEHRMDPSEDLLQTLNMETGVNYAALPESDSLREGLAIITDLSKDADYCDIADQFVSIASKFLTNVESATELSRVHRPPLSLKPRDFAR